jgi:quercetin dioxygenase-like cupin family protein/uncharacterized protein YndB with AHSA1/START domain
MEPFGITVEFLRTGEDTGGEMLEMDVVGRPRGFLSQRHVHPSQTERLEVISGAMKVTMNGQEHLVTEGQWIEVPAGTPHTQLPVGEDPGRVRIQVRPAGRTREFLEQVAKLCREGKINKRGYPRPVAAAQLVLGFSDAGHATAPPLPLQRAIARVAPAAARLSRPYVFVDEWDAVAPQKNVFATLTDSRTYPQWWTPTYREVSAEGEPAVGRESRQKFKARLPYTLSTVSKIVALEPPTRFEVEVDGDLRGHGIWTVTPRTHRQTGSASTAAKTTLRKQVERQAIREYFLLMPPILPDKLRTALRDQIQRRLIMIGLPDAVGAGRAAVVVV